MKKILLIFGFLITSASQAMLVKLPNAETLTKRFKDECFDDLIKKTDIISKLADQEKNGREIILIVDTALSDYSKKVQNLIIDKLMQIRKDTIYKLLLKDSPKILKEIEKIVSASSKEENKKDNESSSELET